MADKILSAQQLLKQKGFEVSKFDTNLFMQDVAEYFLRSDVSAKLLLLPLRFVEIPDKEDSEENPLRITNEDRKNGFKTQTQLETPPKYKKYMKEWERRKFFVDGSELSYVFDLHDYNNHEYYSEKRRGILVPRIIIDKPFIGNAVHTLRFIGGYVAEQKIRQKLKTYDISLL